MHVKPDPGAKISPGSTPTREEASQDSGGMVRTPLSLTTGGAHPLQVPGYRLIETLGPGGQGKVWLAVQVSTHRRVALKVIDPRHLHDSQARARFDQEHRTLKLVRHRGIVRLLDHGVLESGELWQATEFVEGLTLLAYADRMDQRCLNKRRGRRGTVPPVRELVELFSRICEALEAAHAVGVIHRDVKPSNILVEHDGQPKVVDFGLAKLPEGREANAITLPGLFVGTPEWASPEQVEGRPVDVRCDVYALGLLLYRLLTGTMPYDVSGPPMKVFQTILQSDPIPPRTVVRYIDRELQAVMLKPLAKDPDQRYRTVAAFRDDVQRYLRNEPVQAKGTSSGYVLKKWAGRHRVLAAVIIAVAVMSIGYGSAITVMYRDLVAARGQADRMSGHACETVRLVIAEFDEKLRHLPGASELRERLLRELSVKLDELMAEHPDDPTVRADIARVHHRLSDLALQIKKLELAQVHRQQALAIRRQLAASFPTNPQYQEDLSISLVLVGDIAKERKDFTGTVDLYRRALAVQERLVARYPENLHYQDLLAWSYERNGYMAWRLGDEAQKTDYYVRRHEVAERLVGREPENPAFLVGLCESHRMLAGYDHRTPEYLEHVQEAAQISEKLIQIDAHNDQYLYYYLVTQGALGMHELSRSEDFEHAAVFWEQLVPIADRLYQAEPGRLQYLEHYAAAHKFVGEIALARGDHVTAQRELAISLAAFEQLLLNGGDTYGPEALEGAAQRMVRSMAAVGVTTLDAGATLELAWRILSHLSARHPDREPSVKVILEELETATDAWSAVSDLGS